MRKLKLFPKTYLFTMVLMGMIILISHTLLYILLPKFYINKKQNALDNITKNLTQRLEASNEEAGMKIAKEFANKYKVDISITIGDKTNVFKGMNNFDVYVDPDMFKDESLLVFEVEDNMKAGLDSNSNTILNQDNYLKMSGSSIFSKKVFNISDGQSGEFKIVMDLQSLKEARSVVFMILPYSIGISLVISLLASYIYVKIITDPIKKMCKVTKEMKALNKEAYCDIETGDEIEVLSNNINSLYKTLWNTIYSLKKEIDNVSKSEQIKVDFLRSASHELKTPLMSIHIMLENMMLNVGKYKNHEIYLEKCRDAVSNLSNMVQEILDVSRLNISDNNKEYRDLNLEDILEGMIESYKIIAKAKHINMTIDYSNSFKVNTNESLLTKLLSNIISNAVNYTNEGKNIDIYFKDQSIIVENECTPIPDEHLEHIFEAFYRVDFDRNKNTGGNGLGLYIVKQILTTIDVDYSFKATDTGMRFIVNFKKGYVSS